MNKCPNTKSAPRIGCVDMKRHKFRRMRWVKSIVEVQGRGGHPPTERNGHLKPHPPNPRVGHPRCDSELLPGKLQEWYAGQQGVHQNQEWNAVRATRPPSLRWTNGMLLNAINGGDKHEPIQFCGSNCRINRSRSCLCDSN